jgi:TrmH family RNA methyltransferase
MQNFGARRLHVVGGCRPNDPESLGNAVSARPLLEAARRTFDLAATLGPMNFIVGTTGRRRHRMPVVTPKEAAPRILEELARGEVALLFGREDHGLSGEELAHAHLGVNIPASPECRALNLSHAAGVILYEVFAALDGRTEPVRSSPGRVLTRAMAARLERDLESAMRRTGAITSGNEEAGRAALRRLCALGPMQTRDARYLFALARGVERLLGSATGDDRTPEAAPSQPEPEA